MNIQNGNIEFGKKIQKEIWIRLVPAVIFFVYGLFIWNDNQLLAVEALLIAGLFVLQIVGELIKLSETRRKFTRMEYRSPSWEKNDSAPYKTITQVVIPAYVVGGILLMIWFAGRQ